LIYIYINEERKTKKRLQSRINNKRTPRRKDEKNIGRETQLVEEEIGHEEMNLELI
jgi:hypothetical protein